MENVNISISSGVNNAETKVKYKLYTKILVILTITTNMLLLKVDVHSWTNQSFYVPVGIQMIIGAELFFGLLKGGRMKLTGFLNLI